MLNQEEFFNLSKEIKSGFGLRRQFLFIGKNYKAEQLPAALCKQNWSAVLTTSDNEKILSYFYKSDRNVICVNKASMEIEPNTEDMPVIFLHKVDESNDWHDDTTFVGTLISVIEAIRGSIDTLYTVGLYSDELNIKNICRWIPTYFMGQKQLPEHEIPNLKVYEEDLSAFFDESDETNDLWEEEQYGSNENIFFKNGKYVSLSDDVLMNTRRFLTLATEAIVDRNSPVGDKQMSLAFENFLKLSPTEGPQWYGYTPKTNFHVKRPFEDAFVDLVTKALNGETPTKKKYDPTAPIVLMGPPASSKTITLGSLAYRIFSRHNNPIIFIKNYDIDPNDENNFDLLDCLMSNIDDLDGDAKNLLIWDGSSNKNTIAAAISIANKLHNRGRKFVMVCSSYQYSLKEKSENIICYDNNNQTWSRSDIHDDSAQYVCVRNEMQCHIITSYRTATPDEIEAIKDRYKKYAGIDNINESMLPSDGVSDIFVFFYRLAYFLRNPLEKGLKTEQLNISNMYDKELRKIFERRSGLTLGDIRPKFFEKFGLKSSDLNDENKEEYPRENFNKFQECIALFSQFKIKTPRGLAMALLDKKNVGLAYSTDNERIYRFVEEDIPWIHLASVKGELFFEFRNAEEARLYIQEQFKDDCRRCMDLILSLFDTYMEYKKPNKTIVKCFSDLLKELGPNREWALNYESKFAKDFNDYFNTHMDEVIDKLDILIKHDLDFVYSLTLNKITLCREHYGDKSVFTPQLLAVKEECVKVYTDRMEKLASTISFTDGRITDIENHPYANEYKIQKNQMINELTNCNVALFDCQRKYVKYCNDNDILPSEKWKTPSFRPSFVILFDELIKIIYSEPQNGYYYNAVFKIYQRHRSTIFKTDYDVLSRLENIIETSLTITINDRGANGNDEIGEHISQIKEEMCDTKITLEKVKNHDDSIADFLDYHDRMIEKGSAASICFIVSTELLRNGIIGQDRALCKNNFSDEELEFCKTVRDYMMSDEIYEIVNKDHKALQTLFRICWICNEKKDPYADFDKERRTSSMNADEWLQINEICRNYIKVCDYKNIESSYFLNYIYALSMVQIALLSDTGIADGFSRGIEIVNNLNEKKFLGAKRMRVPFLICNDKGEPFTFNFTLIDIKNDNNGIMKMTNPDLTNGRVKFIARAENIGERRYLPAEGTYFEKLAVGLSYTSYSLCKPISQRGEK